MNKLSLLHNIKYIFGRYPLYLIVFCIQLPVSYYEVYSSYYDPFGVLPAILILLILGLALFAVSRSLLRDTQPAGLLALIGLIFLFPKAILTAPVYPLIGIAGLFLVILPIAKRKKTVREALRLPRAFSHAINTVAVTMLIAVGAQSSIHAYEVAAEADDMTAKAYAAVHQTAKSRGPVSLPHIVHIVLDGYSRADVLQSEYGFDNKPFLDALRQRGFRISEKATTPFNQTLLTMSSIFSLGPFTDAISSPVTEKNDTILRRALARSQRHGAVSKLLRDLGYDLQATPTTYFPLQWDQIAGHSGDTPISNRLSLPGTFVFVYDLLQSSWVLDSLAGRLFGGSFDITAINFELIKQVSNRRFQPLDDRPLFVYEHILAPHPPFNISANGEPRPLAGLPSSLSDGAHLIRGDKHKRAQYRDGYVEKLRYINGAILEQIDALKESLSGPIVIILHGDHGGGLHFDQHEKSNTCLNERFSPLLAVYATDPAISNGFTSDFNLVNIYRVVFRRLLDVDLPNLPNRSTYISSAFDESVMLEPGELEVSCAASRKTWTAERRAVPTPHVPPISASR